MRHTLLRRLAAISIAMGVMLAALPAGSARRPRYGGTLRIEMGASVSTLDPLVEVATLEEAAAKSQIDALIYERSKTAGGWELAGPFRISEWAPGKFLSLVANNDYRDGRPFVDSIEIQMGRPAHDRLVDIELNKIDFAEIPAEQARRATERGIRVIASQPDELLALVFVPGGPAAEDARLREAVARTVDRPSIVSFILQKEGEPTGSLLPQWSSGTAFLFPTAADPARAKELSQQIPPSQKIVLGYDSGDSLEQNVAERIVVNAREAGIFVALQPMQQSSGAPDTAASGNDVSKVDMHFIRWSMLTPHPLDALTSLQTMLISLGNADPGPLPIHASSREIYDRELTLLDGYHVVPLVWLPHVYALSSRVRDWQAPEPGQNWALPDLWLEGDAQ